MIHREGWYHLANEKRHSPTHVQHQFPRRAHLAHDKLWELKICDDHTFLHVSISYRAILKPHYASSRGSNCQ